MKFCFGFVVAALLSAATMLNADEFQHEESGLQFDLPKGWTCTEEDGKISIISKDKTVSIVGGVIEKAAAKAIFDDIDGFLDKLEGFEDVEVTHGPKKEKVNGLEQSWYEGTANVTIGEDEMEEIQWDMTIVKGGKGILFLVGTGDLDKNQKKYEAFFESIEKIEDAEE
jgi:hypothetical protein